MKMTDTSLDTLETSYDTNTASQPTDTTLSDDDDDELLALRIAALESIKLQKAKPPPQKEATKQTERDEDKPEFQIKKHSIRSNLLSIVTHDEDQETVIPPPSSLNPEAVPFIPVPVNFDPSRPPPGFGGRGGQLLPFPPPRLPGDRRYSRSRSRSPGPRRRPLSRSPPPGYFRRRSVSPYRRRRSLSPLDRRSPPLRRRSPPPRKSRTPEKPRSPSPSEWETDTEGESEAEEEETEKKEESAVKTKEKKPVVEKKKEVSQDDEGDDILKLDATAEEDEFSAFLNEFEDEVLAKKEEKKKPEKKEKKVRPPTEKKVVEGKKLRKKIKPKKVTPPPAERRSKSPRLTRSPGRRYFSPNRNGDKRHSPRRRDDRASQEKLRDHKSRERDNKSRERDNKSKEKMISNDLKPAETAAERAEREQREYEERIAKLPSPERERMEARRKKFDKKIDTNKKISLKSDKAEDEVKFDVRKRINRASADPDKDDDRRSRSPIRKNVTDLRVALHKKRKAQDGDNDVGQRGKKTNLNSSHPLMRSDSLSPIDKDDLDKEDFGPVKKSNRMVVPPKKSKYRNSEEESDRSPSPPEKLVTKKRKSSGDVSDSLKNRRILVVRKGAGDSDQEEDFSITKRVSPNKGLKKSLHLRLGGKIGEELPESDIYMDILRKQEAKKKLEKEAKKAKKEKRKEKKEKKEKKKSKKKGKGKDSESDEENLSDKHASDVDSGEELFRFFEEEQDTKKAKRRSGSPRRERQVSGKRFVRAKFADDDLDLELESLESRGRHGGGEGKKKIKDKLKRRTSNEGSLDEESLDVLEKMRRKNEKRLKRMKEIEKDKLMFS